MPSAISYAVHPIPADVLADLRSTDDLGRAPTKVVDDAGGSPLRCCLRAARPAEEMLLVSYAPIRRWAAARGVDPAAYDEVGPVFIHPEPCDGPVDGGWPADFVGQPRILRAYDDGGRIVGGVCLDAADDKDRAVRDLCAQPDVALITARAVIHGCFTFAIEPIRGPAVGGSEPGAGAT